MIEKDLFGIFLNILLYSGKERYEIRMLPKRTVITGWTNLNNSSNASTNMMKGTIF